MGEIARQTGVTTASIKYYIKEGLLPKPQKTSRNMAYYEKSFIGKIMFIKELQKKRYLPLKIIKKILTGKDNIANIATFEELRTILSVQGRLFKTITFPVKLAPLSRGELVRRSGISTADLRDLEDKDWVKPENGNYNEDDVLIAEAIASFRSQGFSEQAGFKLKDIEFLRKGAEKVAIEEMKLLMERLREKIFEESSARLAKNGIQIINSLFAVLNKKFIKKIITEMTEGYKSYKNVPVKEKAVFTT